MSRTKAKPSTRTTTRSAAKKPATTAKSKSTNGSATATATKPRRAATTKRSATPGAQSVADRAYDIWMRKGCPAGQDLENWLEAERELARK